MAIYITVVHIFGVYGLGWVGAAKWQTVVWSFALYGLACLGITAGSHRLWAHRSYKASLPLRIFLMILNSIANQGSIIHWARDHRVHHKHSETPADPHNAKRGLFFSHMGWLYVKKDHRVTEAGRKINFDDLYADPVVMFQKHFDPYLAIVMCFIFPAMVANVGWGEGFWIGVWVAGCVRYVLVLHATWLVNSAAHMYGSRPYDPSSNPTENPLVAILSIGEGWHNWHHAYPYDYAASELGISEQFNPTKLFIDVCVALGLAWDTKRAEKMWRRREKKFKHEGKSSEVRGLPLLKQRVQKANV